MEVKTQPYLKVLSIYANFSRKILVFSAASHPFPMTVARKLHCPAAPSIYFKRTITSNKLRNCSFGFKFKENHETARSWISCSMNMAAGHSDEPGKLNIDHIVEKAQKVWDSAPQPVKIFPWSTVADNFVQLIVDLFMAVVKYLSLPVFFVTSVSELSYCAHERKLYFTLFPFLIGAVVAGVLRAAAVESSPLLRNSEVPWHLLCIAGFFTLLKLPGPYYPYWGRIFIPHFANGALVRTLWFAFQWYRRPKNPSETTV